ncbi:dinitrogenase iron-molybdenum cofactor biosynthesis protein [Heliobacterium gestii]|uniref:Dinitrogenase iron-molybdenum cofactor biosynthesis protein n=1 Tax=Heliomicrobium gestii TaxID=2699 RepID=A0A845L7M1_HELGE|nr:NifB/NifX family molybdenum-iron cluster-binding protein [Heliomicrobium gestii]MBM7865947.1 putative Fe-Mo cluster-binding NifX family protein [Heliomicrobium gestii]MZP42717.1 dinitrogenase iron-molybdenum cofactor biosynthesis protein [Heliomicrobium gestii]
MAIKVAVASSDGKLVNQHFGHARRFLIFEVDGQGYRFIEDRPVVPHCSCDGGPPPAVKTAVESLSDCRAVLVTMIGYGPQEKLAAQGVRSIISHDLISDALMGLGDWQDDSPSPY